MHRNKSKEFQSISCDLTLLLVYSCLSLRKKGAGRCYNSRCRLLYCTCIPFAQPLFLSFVSAWLVVLFRQQKRARHPLWTSMSPLAWPGVAGAWIGSPWMNFNHEQSQDEFYRTVLYNTEGKWILLGVSAKFDKRSRSSYCV